MEESTLKAEPRSELGSKATARLRASGRLPVNIYGHQRENRHVSLDQQEFDKFFNHGHRVVAIEVDGVTENGVIREVQYDYLGTDILHVDIARVDLTEEIVMNVPVETRGVAKGVTGGGNLTFNLRAIQVKGPANKIPEKFELNITELDLNDSIHISDLEVPAGCTIENDSSEIIVVINISRASGLAEGEEEGAEGEEAGEGADSEEKSGD